LENHFPTKTTGKEKDVLAMESGGNKKVTAIFEGKINFDTSKPDSRSDTTTRERFIRAKYEERKYYSEASMAKEEKSKPATLGGLALKASKADTAALQLERQQLGYGDDPVQAAAPSFRRQQRRASTAMIVGNNSNHMIGGSSHHQSSHTKSVAVGSSSRNGQESFSDDEADEFGGDASENDEWWEPFDGAAGDTTTNNNNNNNDGFEVNAFAFGSDFGSNAFGGNEFGSNDGFFTVAASVAFGQEVESSQIRARSSGEGQRRGPSRSSSNHSQEAGGEGGGSVSSRRRAPTSRRNLSGEDDDTTNNNNNSNNEPIKPQSRRSIASRRSSLGMSSHSANSFESFNGSAHSPKSSTAHSPKTSRKQDPSGEAVPKSSRRLGSGGAKKKDPLSVSFHDTDFDNDTKEREWLGYGDPEPSQEAGGTATSRKLASRSRRASVIGASSTHSADAADVVPRTRQAPRRVASADDTALVGHLDADGSSPKAPSMRRRAAKDGAPRGPPSTRSLGRTGAVRRSSLGVSSHSLDGEESSVLSSRSNSSRGEKPKSSRRTRSGQAPSSLRNLPGKGGKSAGDADETVTTVSSDDSAANDSTNSLPKPKSSAKLLGALYGGGLGRDDVSIDPLATVAAPVSTPEQRRRPNRRGSCLV
jgi:hypothetical protein